MAFDEKTAVRVRRALGLRHRITEKKMMGALCFLSEGKMCCGVTGAALMIRVGAEGFERALSRPHIRPLKIGRRVARGFALVDLPGFRTEAALARWLAQGLATAKILRASAAKPAARRRRTR